MEKNLIKIFFMDVDGTLTNGTVCMGNDGEIMKCFDIKDGYGIKNILIPYGVLPVIITGRTSKITENRCNELSIEEVHQGISDKLSKLKNILLEKNIDASFTAYIGDDLNDLQCMQFIKENGGVVGCPADAVHQITTIADFVSHKNGGSGAVREFIDWIIERNQK